MPAPVLPATRAWPWLGLTLALAACKFTPDLPAGAVFGCRDDSGCPTGQRCALPATGRPGRCCRAGACDETPPAEPGDAAAADARLDDPRSPPDAGEAEAEAKAQARQNAGDAAVAPSSTCDFAPGTRVVGPREQPVCVLYALDDWLGLAIETLVDGDPATTRRHNGCYVPVTLTEPSLGPDGSPGPAPTPSGTLLGLVAELQQLCARHSGRLLGGWAGGWARRAPHGPAVLAELRAKLGLDLEVLAEEQILADVYRASARNRRGRIVLVDYLPAPELIVWPFDAPAPSRHRLALDYEEVGRRFLASSGPGTFAELRRALRAELDGDLRDFLRTVELLVAAGQLSPEVSVGPTWPVVPLAVSGLLRQPGSWRPAEEVARVTFSQVVHFDDFGWSFGAVRPHELDGFLDSLTASDLTELRWPAIRYGYGRYLALGAVLAETLAEEVGATRFGYVDGNLHATGFLFRKLAPAL